MSFRSFLHTLIDRTAKRLAWEGKIKERLTISPSVGFYNLFNFANFDLPGNALTGSLAGSSGSINGTSNATRPDRVGVGTGVFAQGSPRVVEFGLKLSFSSATSSLATKYGEEISLRRIFCFLAFTFC